MKILVFNETSLKFREKSIKLIANVFEKYLGDDLERKSSFDMGKDIEMNLIIKTREGIVGLNKDIFKRNYPTDVISVKNPVYMKNNNRNIGDIYISPEVISENAKRFDADYSTELKRIIIHGILHLFGMDHTRPFPGSNEEIFDLQEYLLDETGKE